MTSPTPTPARPPSSCSPRTSKTPACPPRSRRGPRERASGPASTLPAGWRGGSGRPAREPAHQAPGTPLLRQPGPPRGPARGRQLRRRHERLHQTEPGGPGRSPTLGPWSARTRATSASHDRELDHATVDGAGPHGCGSGQYGSGVRAHLRRGLLHRQPAASSAAGAATHAGRQWLPPRWDKDSQPGPPHSQPALDRRHFETCPQLLGQLTSGGRADRSGRRSEAECEDSRGLARGSRGAAGGCVAVASRAVGSGYPFAS